MTVLPHIDSCLQNAAGFSVAFLLFVFPGSVAFSGEIPSSNLVPESAVVISGLPPESDSGSGPQGVKQEVVAKTQEIFDGVVSGELNAQQHARSFDSFLTATFYRIQDALELCRHELILAREAAHEEAERAKNAVLEKLPDLPSLPK